ncbi:hypothetical protein BH10BAC2_BH10BAC2_24480 [soil metagenome]
MIKKDNNLYWNGAIKVFNELRKRWINTKIKPGTVKQYKKRNQTGASVKMQVIPVLLKTYYSKNIKD